MIGGHGVEETIVVRKGKSLQLGGAMSAKGSRGGVMGRETEKAATSMTSSSSVNSAAPTARSTPSPVPNQDAAIDGILSGLTPSFLPAPVLDQAIAPSARLAADVPDEVGGGGGWERTAGGEVLDPGDFGWSDDDDF